MGATKKSLDSLQGQLIDLFTTIKEYWNGKKNRLWRFY
jgi:hypothetical protein